MPLLEPAEHGGGGRGRVVDNLDCSLDCQLTILCSICVAAVTLGRFLFRRATRHYQYWTLSSSTVPRILKHDGVHQYRSGFSSRCSIDFALSEEPPPLESGERRADGGCERLGRVRRSPLMSISLLLPSAAT